MGRRSDYTLKQPTWRRLHNGAMPVRTHTGAGDTIIQAGLMVELSVRYGHIAVPCYHKCFNLGQTLYKDFPLISLYMIPNEHEGHLCSPTDAVFDEAYRLHGLDEEQEIRIGEYAGEGIWHDFIKAFYLQSGVPYSARWDSSPLPECLGGVRMREWYSDNRIFIHDDPDRGYHITRATGYRPEWSSNILEYSKMLIEADEIHVIDSSFFCLANQLPVTGKLFYHWYARPDRPQDFQYELRQEWTYLR